MKLKTIALFLFAMSSLVAFGQAVRQEKKMTKNNLHNKLEFDSLVPGFTLAFSYGYQYPGGDLLWRFGPNSNAGASLTYKNNNNVFFMAQWGFIFGKNLRGQNPLDSISTSDGHVIDKEGKAADVRIFERGFTLSISAGKIFNTFLSPNKNSGLLLTGGLGYLQHKFKIYDNGSRTPQLTKEYLKGYDRLTSGIAITEFIGYWFMSKNQYVNFYGGFEFTQGFTKSRRSWDYNLMRADTESRIDLLSGLRIGWIIPLYKKNAATKYYY
jgi:hypothetical protein